MSLDVTLPDHAPRLVDRLWQGILWQSPGTESENENILTYFGLFFISR